MTFLERARQTDPAEFKRMYHDPTVHSTEIAAYFHIAKGRLSEFAHLLGVETRREVRVRYTPSLKQVLGKRGCNYRCPAWRHCNNKRRWLSILPCEVVVYDEELVDTEADSLRLHTPFNAVISEELLMMMEAA